MQGGSNEFWIWYSMQGDCFRHLLFIVVVISINCLKSSPVVLFWEYALLFQIAYILCDANWKGRLITFSCSSQKISCASERDPILRQLWSFLKNTEFWSLLYEPPLGSCNQWMYLLQFQISATCCEHLKLKETLLVLIRVERLKKKKPKTLLEFAITNMTLYHPVSAQYCKYKSPPPFILHLKFVN